MLLALLQLVIVVQSDALTLYQNMTVSEAQSIGTVIGAVGSGQIIGWTSDAGPPYQIYMTTADAAGISVSSAGLVTVAGSISRQQKSLYQFVAVSANNVDIMVSLTFCRCIATCTLSDK